MSYAGVHDTTINVNPSQRSYLRIPQDFSDSTAISIANQKNIR